MKIQKKDKIKILLTLLLLIITSVIGFYLYYKTIDDKSYDTNNGSIDYSKPTDEQIDSGLNIKEQSIKNDQKRQEEVALENIITSAVVEKDILHIRNEISGLYNDGLCTLSLSQDENNNFITKNTGIQALAKSSTCKGFDIPLNELQSGVWNIEISVLINGRTDISYATVEIK